MKLLSPEESFIICPLEGGRAAHWDHVQPAQWEGHCLGVWKPGLSLRLGLNYPESLGALHLLSAFQIPYLKQEC